MPAGGWYGVAACPELILNFLRVFSRFEYALKAVKDFREGTANDPTPAWVPFARAVSSTFEETRRNDHEFADAVDYILQSPPKKVIVKGDELDWKEVSPEGVSDSEKVVRMVRRVRNNLFHGGKFLPDPKVDPDRDRRLIESSLTVLGRCVGLRRDVQDAYRK